MSVNGGPARRLTDDPSGDLAGSWSGDGRTIHFVSWRSGERRVYSMPATGGPARPLSSLGTVSAAPLESPDGHWVYFLTPYGMARARSDGSRDEVIVNDSIIGFHPTARGVFYLVPGSDRQSAVLKVVPLNGGPARTLGTLPRMAVGRISVSPDFSRMLYARCDQCAADIMLVENFK